MQFYIIRELTASDGQIIEEKRQKAKIIVQIRLFVVVFFGRSKTSGVICLSTPLAWGVWVVLVVTAQV